MKRISILVVDDEEPLRKFIRKNLEVRGFLVTTASNGIVALEKFDKELINLVILDVMMPIMDGLETIRRIRENSTVPIIVLSALGEERDKIQAFNLGADDYLTKPFGVGELLARVKAVLRRANWEEIPVADEQIEQGNIFVDVGRHSVDVLGEGVVLTPTEFNLLVLLMRNSGKVLSHQRILKQIWGPEYGQESEYLRVYVGRLRQKLEQDPANPVYLHTEHGIGYCFEKREG
ncbi:MAG: response regulator transcription factor [Chloroflexota bacterium]